MAPSVGHAELNDELNAYLDGELADDVRARVEAHLATCPVCQLELDQLRATRQTLRAMAPLRAPRAFTLEAAPGPELGRTVARPGPAWPAALGWVWRLGSLASTAFLLVALLVTNVPLPMAGTNITRGADEKAASGFQEGPAGVLADRDSSQRVAPPASPAAQGTAPAAALAPPSRPQVPGGAGGAVPQGQESQRPPLPTPQAGAALTAQQERAGAAAGQPPPATATAVRALDGVSLSSAPDAAEPAPVADLGKAERERLARGRGGAIWVALALVTAAASAAAFAVDRRLRRKARLVAPGR
jgi:anti-sigma factor RsiW